jgi:crotonobetainyl-CoA:carnitine CoA-transferase CaiB-like acyl-CoA transferase
VEIRRSATEIHARTGRTNVPAIGALDDLRVLDLSNLFAAPLVSAILGDFGADVVKVEPPAGDPLRMMGAQRDGRPITWSYVNRNKRGVTLALDTPDGQALFRELAGKVDVLVENLTPELRQRWHCTYDELAALNPNLIVVSVSCYGLTGPYASRPGAGTLAEAFAGLTHMTGEADGPPMLPSVPLGDMLTAIVGALGAVIACYGRRAGNTSGELVDVSMYEPVLQLLASTVAGWEPGSPVPTRTGSRVPNGVPRNVYRTVDGEWLVVSGTTDAQVARVLRVIGHDTEDGRRRFGTSAARLKVADELDALVAEWIAARSRDEVVTALLHARIPAAPVNDVDAVLRDPHVVDRGNIVTLIDDVLGKLSMVAPAPSLGSSPGTIRMIGPELGADNAAVYGELLGVDAARLARLRETGAL